MGKVYTLHFDGSCWPNPGGKAGYGFTLEDSDGNLIEEGHGVVGTGPKMSNNVAEFHALRQGLIAFQRHRCECGPHSHPYNVEKQPLSIFGDSNMVVKIMRGEWMPTPGKLYYNEWAAASVEWLRVARYADIQIRWVPRAQNQRCDDLSKGR